MLPEAHVPFWKPVGEMPFMAVTSAWPVGVPPTFGRKPRVCPLADNSIGMPNCTMLVRSAASPDLLVSVSSIVS